MLYRKRVAKYCFPTTPPRKTKRSSEPRSGVLTFRVVYPLKQKVTAIVFWRGLKTEKGAAALPSRAHPAAPDNL